MSDDIRPEEGNPDETDQEFTPELQEKVGDGKKEQPGADGAPLNEDYDHEPEQGDDDPEELAKL